MEPLLYILMRDDLISLNPGKAVAQGSHATNLFERYISRLDKTQHKEILDEVADWRGADAGDFGTCLCVAVKGRQLDEFMTMAQDTSFPADVVHDHTYPLKDGETTHYIPLDTCAFVFIWDDRSPCASWLISRLKRLSLYP